MRGFKIQMHLISCKIIFTEYRLRLSFYAILYCDYLPYERFTINSRTSALFGRYGLAVLAGTG